MTTPSTCGVKIAGIPEDRIIRIPTMVTHLWDNGPDHQVRAVRARKSSNDHGDHIWGGPPGSADEDGDRFIEIWNLVFMQFEQTPDERLELPRPSIDTGMGLERIAALLQGQHAQFTDIDLFRRLITASEDATGVPAGGQEPRQPPG